MTPIHIPMKKGRCVPWNILLRRCRICKPGKGMSQNISFSVDNNIEMKMKSDKDSTGYKKISLIDQLGGSLSYDFANRRWSDLSMNLRLKLTKSYTFNMNASFATYAYQFDENGNVVVGDRTEWSYGRFGRFQDIAAHFLIR